MPRIDGPTIELEYQEYENHAFMKVDSIIDRIVMGENPMANDLNVFADIGEEIMNPPTAWSKIILNKVEARVDRIKNANLENNNSNIRYYIFKFALRERGNRATVLFSYTAALPR